MSKGTPVRSVRINANLWREILNQVISLKIWSPKPGEWTVSRFIAAACREKLAKMARSRKKRRLDSVGDLDGVMQELSAILPRCRNYRASCDHYSIPLLAAWLCETCLTVWEDNLPGGTPACSYCGARARKLTSDEYLKMAPLHFHSPGQ